MMATALVERVATGRSVGPAADVGVHRLGSTEELEARAAAWNRLWDASATDLAALRAQPVALWCRTFLKPDALEAWYVEAAGRPVAGLPLVRRREKGLLPVRAMPTNAYMIFADPLLDQDLADPAAVMRELLGAVVDRLPRRSFLWLQEAAYQRPAWTLLIDTARRMGLHVSVRDSYEVGWVTIGEPWEAYERTRRRNAARCLKHLERRYGPVTLVRSQVSTPLAARQAVRLLFEIEALGWKADRGTAVVQHPPILAYYQEFGRLMADEGRLAVYFLKVADQPIAGAYACQSKGTVYVHKIGCDEAFRKFGPGQVMFYLLLEQLHRQPDVHALSFCGRLSDYQLNWVTHTERVGRVVIAPRGLRSALLFGAYEHVYPRLKRAAQYLHRRRSP